MAEDRSEQEGGFTVVDRRHGREAMEERRGDEPAGGSEEAARREPPQAATPPPPGGGEPRSGEEPPGAAEQRGRAEGPGRGEPGGTDRSGGARNGSPSEQPAPGIDFATFVLSLSTSALHHLGLVAEQEGAAPPPPNLPMARQTIDILEILQEKTRGNLDPEEEHLLQGLLYELRMRFVEVQEQRGGQRGGPSG